MIRKCLFQQQIYIYIFVLTCSVLNSRPISLISQESAERYNRMLSERAQEIQELRKQLSEREQRLVTTERQSSAAAQEGHLETAELRALLAEKDSIINVSPPHGTHDAYWNTECTSFRARRLKM